MKTASVLFRTRNTLTSALGACALTWTLCAGLWLAPQVTQAAEVWGRCWTCHKEDGKSFVDPIVMLSGQNKQYLINQLYRFKTGERKERMLYVMNGIAEKLTDEEIEAVATHYSQQDPRKYYVEPEPLTDPEDIRLYELGATHARVCLTCHRDAETRPALRGDFPYISGQNYPALVIQLYAFASGARKNPMMNFIQAPPFSDPDVIEGIAFYFSRQIPPPALNSSQPTPAKTAR